MSEKTNFKPIHTTLEKLSTIPISNGQFILVKDDPSIFADIQNNRFKVADTTDYEIVDINSGNLVGGFMKGCTYDKTYEGFYIQKSGGINSYTQYRTDAISFTNVSKLIIEGTIKNNGGKITNIGYIYITDDENASFNSSTWTEIARSNSNTHTPFSYELDTSDYLGKKYVYFAIYHGEENNSYTSFLYFSSINCIYSLNIPEGRVKYIPGNGIAFIPNEDLSVTIENIGATIEIIDDYWYINGVNTEVKALGTDGKDGITPVIEIDPDTKIWIINGVNTGISSMGAEGYSPIANVTTDKNISTITITDKQGTTTAQVISPSFSWNKTESGVEFIISDINGVRGVKVDGYSPTVDAVETDFGYDMNVTDIEGTKTYKIYNGKDGIDGITTVVSQKQCFYATFTADGWQGSRAPYTQTITLDAMTEELNPVVDLVVSDVIAVGLLEEQNYNHITKIITGSQSLTAYCYKEKPTIDINIIVEVD